MYLKRVEIKGFKSFADRVDIELDKGITAVVGPNGSGKSNISDGVRWVLGEQSARTLRGMKMEDVIFAGTDSRKPLGFAEVSITIDNSDGMMPVDYSEVTITRRMYRSGESEYYINRSGCRLKDINELFMDTGIGRDGYSIIGQGRIDEILNAKPEERREVFEEAAGIVKYKTRKLESERKLEATHQNIMRIVDITKELNNQIGPLSEQSEKAKQYLNLREDLKVLELNLFIRNIERTKDKISGIIDYLSSTEKELFHNKDMSTDLDVKYVRVRNLLQQLDEDFQKLQEKIYTIDKDIEKSNGEINVLNEKSKNTDSNMLRLDEELNKEEEELERLKAIFKDNEEKLRKSQEFINEQLGSLGIKTVEFNSLSTEIDDKVQEIENLKSDIIQILNETSEIKNSMSSLNSYKNNIEKRKDEIEREISDNEIEASKLEKDLKSITHNIEKCNVKLQNKQGEITKINLERIEILENKAVIEKNISELNNKLHSRNARHRVLCEMENDFEGYSKSVKEVMKLRNSSFANGINGTVAELISVDAKYEVAIEIALGAALQNIVTEDDNTAKQCIAFLKKNKLGRATFLPLTTVKGRNGGPFDDEVLRNKNGYIGIASNLIKFDGKYRGIFSHLLGKVIIANNIDNAGIIARHINYSARIVTLEGDVISPGGAFTGGSVSQNSSRILSRKREIDQLESDMKEIESSLYILGLNRDEIGRKLLSIEDNMGILTSEKHSCELEMTTLDSMLNQKKTDIEKVMKNIENLNRESCDLYREYEDICSKINEKSNLLSQQEKKSQDISVMIQEEQLGIKDKLNYKESLSSEITSLKISIAEYRQGIIALEDRVKEVKESIIYCKDKIDRKSTEKGLLTLEIKKVEEEIYELESHIKLMNTSNSASKSQLETLNASRKDALVALDNLENERKKCSEISSSLQDEIHKGELQKAKLEIEIQTLQDRIWEEYEVSYASALKYKVDIENINKAIKEINSIKESIKRLGSVNIAAIEEYKKVKERYEFLSKQKEDLEEAKCSLMKVIDEMVDRMRNQFSRNFSIIKENFNDVFQQLFGGGKAELVLTDERNVLESGIDIIAQPPGKKPQSLSLLSGGEKALTAIALLFAILKMKPSPFCILDEIEAALDDVNVNRYAEFLKKFSEGTQFIIITHRKGTMEASDSLYGVTMEEKGISRLVSVKLNEKAS